MKKAGLNGIERASSHPACPDSSRPSTPFRAFLSVRRHCHRKKGSKSETVLQEMPGAVWNILLGAGIDLGNVAEQVDDTAGVTPLVVVPRYQLDEVVVEREASLGIEDGGVGVADQIGRDDLVLGVGEYACPLLASLFFVYTFQKQGRM
jgi:hypothetical protein